MRILITGNGSGIGKAIAEDLAREHHVLGTHFADGRRLWDVTNEDDNQENFDLIKRYVGGLDALVSNAGVLDTEPFGRLTVAGIERVMRTNFIAPLLLAQEAVNLGAKIIINVGSMYGVTGAYGKKPIYAASKAALHNATLSLARACGPSVRCVGVAPGIVDTGIHREQGGIAKHGNGHSLVARLGTPAEVAHAVRFALENNYVNGTIIEVSGGR